MMLAPLSWLKRSSQPTGRITESQRRSEYRPYLDTLEDRTVLSSTPLVNLPLDVGPFTVATTTVNGQQTTQLQASVSIAGHVAGTLVMDATTTAPAQQGDCPILNLEVQPINLNLLGLQVNTNAISLEITAHEGEGSLGNLVCNLADGLDLNAIIDQLDNVASNLNTFLGQLGNLLDGVLGQNMVVTDVFGTASSSATLSIQQSNTGTCDILGLSLGPVNLDLLGVDVSLDNGNNGPVTVDVTASSTGGELGNLLCSLADGDLNGLILNRVVTRVDRLIDQFSRMADRLEEISHLPNRFQRVADRLVDQIERVVDRVDSLSDLDRLVSRITRVTRQLDRMIDNTDASEQVIRRIESVLAQLTRIINRFHDLGVIHFTTNNLERVIDVLMARL